MGSRAASLNDGYQNGADCSSTVDDLLLCVNDGLTVLGRVYGHEAGPFRAELADGTVVGVFSKLKHARQAISRARAG